MLIKKEIPEIHFDGPTSLDVEVMSFSRLNERLNQSLDHDPFSTHRVEFYLILIVTQNTYTHFIDFEAYNAPEGSAIFVAKKQVHHFTKSLEEASGIAIIFNSLFIDSYFFVSDERKLNRLFNYHIETPVILKKEMGNDNFHGIATQLYNEYNFPDNFAKSEILRTLLHLLILKAERTKQTRSAGSNTKTLWLETFSNFKSMLEKEYVNTRSSRAYAAKLLVSYKFLNDVTKKLTGKTVKAFIDDFVIIEIKRYLVSTSLSVKEISYHTGFEEPANMIKFFKKHTALTPLTFRRQK